MSSLKLLPTSAHCRISLKREPFKLSVLRECIWNSLFRCFHWTFIREHLIDIASVLRILHDWFVRGRYDSISQISPVYVPEEWVTHYVGSVVRGRGAETLRLVTIKQTSQQGFSLTCKVTLHLYRYVNDVIHHLLSILLVVRRSTTKHLVEQCTQAPPVGSLAVPVACDNLRGQILRRATV